MPQRVATGNISIRVRIYEYDHLVKPGGNLTGSSYLANEYAGKLLQLLKEAVPRLRSVAVFINPGNEAAAPLITQMRADTVGLRECSYWLLK